jgi:hypothetical protein
MNEVPHIGVDEDGCATMEWWNGDRKITFYTWAPPHEALLKSWGPNIDTQMEFVQLSDIEGIRAAFAWLRAARPTKELASEAMGVRSRLLDLRTAALDAAQEAMESVVPLADAANPRLCPYCKLPGTPHWTEAEINRGRRDERGIVMFHCRAAAD